MGVEGYPLLPCACCGTDSIDHFPPLAFIGLLSQHSPPLPAILPWSFSGVVPPGQVHGLPNMLSLSSPPPPLSMWSLAQLPPPLSLCSLAQLPSSFHYMHTDTPQGSAQVGGRGWSTVCLGYIAPVRGEVHANPNTVYLGHCSPFN